jgi:hypothetical protein
VLKKVLYLAGVLCLGVSCVNLHGQTQGEMTGEVTDPSGALMPGATVTVTNEATNATRQMRTNATGVYSFPALLPGTYTLKTVATGFDSEVRSGIELQVQQVVRIDFRMTVGQTNQTVNVSAAVPLLNTADLTVGTVIDTKRISDLPLNGRNFLQLVELSPNVVYGFAPAGQQVTIEGGQRAETTISIAGQREEFNYYTLDGMNNTDDDFNNYLLLPSIDALQEFKVQYGVYPAEYGRNVGQINVSTKSGSNDFHGALWDFVRNSVMDADNFAFVAGVPLKSPLSRNQFGYTLGGPVIFPKLFNGKNKLFFMTNYEGQRWYTALQEVATVPSIAMRSGNFSGISTAIYDPATRVQNGSGQITAQPFPGNVIPTNRFDPYALKLLNYFPAPNVAGVTNNNYLALENEQQNADQFTVRMDFNESAKSTWFFRYSWSNEADLTPSTFPVQGNLLTTGVHQSEIGNTRVLTSTIVNEFLFGYSGFTNLNLTQSANTQNVIGELGGIPGLATPTPITYGIPNITLTGYTGFGDSYTVPDISHDHVFQWIDNVSIVRGKHSIGFGAEIRRDEFNQEGNQFAAGQFQFTGFATQNPRSTQNTGNAMADYLLGAVRTSGGSVEPLAVAQLRATDQYYYIQDAWKARPNLTINAGLRYELEPPYWGKHDELINTQLNSLPTKLNSLSPPTISPVDPNNPPVVVRAGTGNNFYQGLPFVYGPGIVVAQDGRLGKALVKTDYNDWAPRVGLVYSPSPNWTIRSGFGIFYARDIGNAVYDMSRNTAPRRGVTANNNFPNLTLENPFGLPAGGSELVVATPTILSNTYNMRTPYEIQYELNTQRQLAAKSTIEIGYLGSEGHHLNSLYEANTPLPGPGSSQTNRPFPALGPVQNVRNNINSTYNSLEVKFTQQMSHGVNALVGYTFARSIDDGGSDRQLAGDTDFPQNNYDFKAGERGPSVFNQQNRLVTSLLWEPPLGKGQAFLNHGVAGEVLGNWQLNVVLIIGSGVPFTLSDGVDVANIGGTTAERPSYSGAPLNPPNGKSRFEWFNPAAYTEPAAYTYGNVSRNSVWGPGLVSWDSSVMKMFPIWKEQNLQFRFEAFNVPNHPNFAIPGGSLQSTTFGVITSTATDMRQLQLSLKYIF